MVVVLPTEDQLRDYILHVIQHCCNVEYFLDHLDINPPDTQRPHDIVGQGNKLEWKVMSGLSSDIMPGQPGYNLIVVPARDLHRLGQHHHKMFNNPDPNDKSKPNPLATIEDMIEGAIDAVCSRLESREYQGGIFTYDQMIDGTVEIPEHKKPFIHQVVPLMREIEQPNLELITDIHSFPNIGLPDNVYQAIVREVQGTLVSLGERGYFL